MHGPGWRDDRRDDFTTIGDTNEAVCKSWDENSGRIPSRPGENDDNVDVFEQKSLDDDPGELTFHDVDNEDAWISVTKNIITPLER